MALGNTFEWSTAPVKTTISRDLSTALLYWVKEKPESVQICMWMLTTVSTMDTDSDGQRLYVVYYILHFHQSTSGI